MIAQSAHTTTTMESCIRTSPRKSGDMNPVGCSALQSVQPSSAPPRAGQNVYAHTDERYIRYRHEITPGYVPAQEWKCLRFEIGSSLKTCCFGRGLADDNSREPAEKLGHGTPYLASKMRGIISTNLMLAFDTLTREAISKPKFHNVSDQDTRAPAVHNLYRKYWGRLGLSAVA